jgi:hypothetical protein
MPAIDIGEPARYMERWIGMRRWDYVLFGVPAVLLATGAIMMIDGHILGEATTSVASAIGLLGIFIMLYASRKAAAQKARK